ncbi:MAG: hypothetical protein ACHQ9S_23860 [Candidatus Binatia bacterium]
MRLVVGVALAGALLVGSASSCSNKMAHQVSEVVQHPPEVVVPLQKGEACQRWCEAVAATCLNRCKEPPEQCQETCGVQRLECLKGC